MINQIIDLVEQVGKSEAHLGKVLSEEYPSNFFERIEEDDIDGAFIQSAVHGLVMSIREGKLSMVMVYLRREGDYHPYEGSLPYGIERGDTKDSLLAKFGVPHQFGGGVESKFLGKIPVWVKFKMGEKFIHFELDDYYVVQRVSFLDF